MSAFSGAEADRSAIPSKVSGVEKCVMRDRGETVNFAGPTTSSMGMNALAPR